MTTPVTPQAKTQAAALRMALGPGFMFAGPSDRVLAIAAGRGGSTRPTAHS